MRTSRSPWPVALEARQAGPRGGRPGPSGSPPGSSAGPGPSGVRTGTSPPRSASPRVRAARAQVGAVAGEDRVGRLLDDEVEVTAAVRLAGQADALPVSAPGGILTSSRLPSTSMRRFVPWKTSSRSISATASAAGRGRVPVVRGRAPAVAALRRRRRPAHAREEVLEGRSAGRSPAAARSRTADRLRASGEERAEEVAEAAVGVAVELEADPARPAAVAREAGERARPPRAASGARRRAGLGVRLPVRAELVVQVALLRVGQDLVGLADLLEPPLGRGVALVHVRMVLARRLAERLLDVGLDAVRGTPRVA